jgi:hypothetical protein
VGGVGFRPAQLSKTNFEFRLAVLGKFLQNNLKGL